MTTNTRSSISVCILHAPKRINFLPLLLICTIRSNVKKLTLALSIFSSLEWRILSRRWLLLLLLLMQRVPVRTTPSTSSFMNSMRPSSTQMFGVRVTESVGVLLSESVSDGTFETAYGLRREAAAEEDTVVDKGDGGEWVGGRDFIVS